MKLNTLMCAIVIAAVCTMAAAQDYPKAEVSVGYSYLMQNTEITALTPFLLSGDVAKLPLGGLNGGDAAVTFNLNSVLGIKADFSGYTQSGPFATSGKVFDFAAGPVLKKHSGAFNPFAELLVGVAHKSVSGFSLSGGENAFTAIVGGGVDFKLSQHFSVRAAEVDYVWTAYHTVNPTDFLNVSARQNNFREVSGIVFTF